MNTNNRESYLNNFIDTFALEHFKYANHTISKELRDNIRVTNSMTGSKKHIGEHWSPEASTGAYNEILISPFIDDSIMVLGVLLHELVHAKVGNEEGHNHVFRKCAVAIGLEGKMTATTESPELKIKLQKWIDKNGEYPHKKMIEVERKKQGTRMIKYVCSDTPLDFDTMKLERGYYHHRTTQGMVDEIGVALCPCCQMECIPEAECIQNQIAETNEEFDTEY